MRTLLIIVAGTTLNFGVADHPAEASGLGQFEGTIQALREKDVEPVNRRMAADIATYKACIMDHALALGRASREDANTIITAAAGMCSVDEITAVSDMENVDTMMDWPKKSEADEQTYVQGWRNAVLPLYLMARANSEKSQQKRLAKPHHKSAAQK